MKDRFHLEQEIMDCWGVTDDVQTIIDHCEELTVDQLMNSLIGIKELYDLKFRTMFDTFEGLVSTMKIGNKPGAGLAAVFDAAEGLLERPPV